MSLLSNLTTDEIRKIDIQGKNIFAEPTNGRTPLTGMVVGQFDLEGVFGA